MTLRGLALALGFCAACTSGRPPEPQAPTADPHVSKATAERAQPPVGPAPRLVVWLTIDQLRGDSFSRFAHLITSDGFGALLGSGRHFTSATYAHAITETAPGHATLFTGASPSEHGIVANEWLTRDGKPVTSVLDPSAPLVGPEIDASETEPGFGRSPRHLLLPTVGDALRQATRGQAKVVSVSVKDRGAILPAGRAGHAFWLGKRGFVTSRYYASVVPELLASHLERHPPSSYVGAAWSLLLPESKYQSRLERPTLGSRVDARVETFPHRPPPGTTPAAWLRSTPFGDQAALDLAVHVLDALELGRDDVVDLLAVSLSSNDYVGHLYGPESREAEDTFARLDRLLSGFLAYIEQQVERERVLFVLSADHGISESPESQRDAGLPAGRLAERELEVAVRGSLQNAHGHDHFFSGIALPSVYLDRTAIARSGQDSLAVAARLANDLSKHAGVYRAYSLTHMRDGSEQSERVRQSIHEGRSGDVYVVLDPHHQIADGDYAASHGSPWLLDRHVPIVLRGPGVQPGTDPQPVDVRSLAGTVADLAGVPAPAGAHPGRLFSARPVGAPGD